MRPDIYLVSYPRSGRSWIRALYLRCFQLLNQGIKTPFFWVPSERKWIDHPEIPYVKPTHDGQSSYIRKGGVGTVEQRLEKYKDTPIILLKRDPKDIIVSYHNFVPPRRGVKIPFSDFVQSERYGLARIEGFYKVWDEAKKSLNVKEIWYEDFHRDTIGSLKDLLEWIMPQIEWKQGWIEEAVKFASLKNMQKIMLDGIDFLPEARTGRVGDGNEAYIWIKYETNV